MHFDTYFCCFFPLILRILLFVFHAEVSNFSDQLYCGLMMQLFHPAIVHIYYIYSLSLGQAGFEKSEDSLSESCFYNDKWDMKG